MPKPTFVIVVRESWQQAPVRSVDGVMFAQQVGGSFKWDVLGFLGKACGIRDDQLEKGRSVESLALIYPKTKQMWPPELTNELEGLIGRANDYCPAGPGKEAYLQLLFLRLTVALYYVNTWAEASALQAEMEEKLKRERAAAEKKA